MPKEDTQFKPGQSGNPKGKPPGTKSFTTKVREALMKIADGKDYTNEEAFIRKVLEKAIVDGNESIIRLIWNYLDGMPHQTVDTTIEVNPTPLLEALYAKKEEKQEISGEVQEIDQETSTPDPSTKVEEPLGPPG